MNTYTTQMNAAKKGIITKEMRDVLASEAIDEKTLLQKMSEGKIVIPANKNHKSLRGIAVGEGVKTKVNVNLGGDDDILLGEPLPLNITEAQWEKIVPAILYYEITTP